MSEKAFKSLEKVGKAFKGVGNVLKSFTGLLDKLNIFEPLIEIFSGWLEILGSAFAPVIQKIADVMIKLTPFLLVFAEGLAKFLDLITSGEFWKEAGEKIRNWFNNIGDWFKEAWMRIKDWFNRNIIDPIKNFFRNMLNAIIGFINIIIEGINFIIPGKRYDIPKVSASV